MKKLNPFAKSSITYFFATLIGQGMTFLSLIVFTRIMSQESYGLYSTYYAYVSICTVLVGANLFVALNNAYIDIKEDVYGFRKAALFLSSVICMVLMLLALIAREIAFRQLALPLVLFAFAHSYSFFVVNFRMYSANMENDRKKKSLLLILPNAFQFLFSLVLIVLFRDHAFYARVIGSTLGVLCCALVVYVEMAAHKSPLVNGEYWKYGLKISVPTIAMSISYMLMQQCDKVMITEICGEEFTAVYAVLFYLSYAMIVVNQAIGAVRQVWVFKMLDKKDGGGFTLLQKWYLAVILVMVLGTFMIAPEAIRILVPRNYWEFEYVVPFVFSASMMVMYGFDADTALFYKRNTVFSLCVVAAAVINLALNVVFIRRYGAIAAAYTTAAAYLFLFFMLRAIFGKDDCARYSWKYFSVFLLCVCLSCVLYSFTIYTPVLRYGLFLGLLVLLGLFFLLKKNEWMILVTENGKGGTTQGE